MIRVRGGWINSKITVHSFDVIGQRRQSGALNQKITVILRETFAEPLDALVVGYITHASRVPFMKGLMRERREICGQRVQTGHIQPKGVRKRGAITASPLM